MKSLVDSILPLCPETSQQEVEEKIKHLILKIRQQLLGEVQTMLAAYNVSRQSDLDLLRREIDRIFLENQEP